MQMEHLRNNKNNVVVSIIITCIVSRKSDINKNIEEF